ncbi:bacteriophage holin [Patescibacteria group bacterium]|nr:bacteriophage holin [Patescibacteria group bacterium]
MEKLNVKKFAIACGVTWGLGVLLLGWLAGSGWGGQFVSLISSLYIGYGASFVGGIIGGVWAFFDGAVGGAILAWIYNMAKK